MALVKNEKKEFFHITDEVLSKFQIPAARCETITDQELEANSLIRLDNGAMFLVPRIDLAQYRVASDNKGLFAQNHIRGKELSARMVREPEVTAQCPITWYPVD